MNAIAREREHLLPVYAQLDIEPVSASGVWIHTVDGRRLLDLYGGHAVTCLGYAHPALVATLTRQAENLLFQSNAVALDVRAQAARRLTDFAPEGISHAFFVNSGAEANENALRLAIKATGRDQVVALEHSFHGRSAAAAAVTWNANWYGFPRRPFDVTFVPHDDAQALAAAVDERTAAVILEPVQGLAGAYDLDVEFLRAARRACDAAGAWLIADEVQSGMGRCGVPFAIQRAGVLPEVITTAKSLGGGFPVGAVLTRAGAAEIVRVGDLGTTFGGGPMACALIDTVVETITSQNLMERIRQLSSLIRETCVLGPVTGVQGAGFLLGLKTTRPAREIARELLERDIVVGGSADPHVIRLLPPYILEEAHVALLAGALKEIAA